MKRKEEDVFISNDTVVSSSNGTDNISSKSTTDDVGVQDDLEDGSIFYREPISIKDKIKRLEETFKNYIESIKNCYDPSGDILENMTEIQLEKIGNVCIQAAVKLDNIYWDLYMATRDNNHGIYNSMRK